jgi:transcriptional regulator with XRE-family HTH domain
MGMQDPVAVRKNLGKRVRQLRQKRGLSQEGFAHASGLGRSFAGSIERGERDIRITTLCKLANFFGVPMAQLFKR